MTKLVMNTTEIATVLGCSDGYARRVHREIRMSLKRTNHKYITYKEFSNYYGFTLEEVKEVLHKAIHVSM